MIYDLEDQTRLHYARVFWRSPRTRPRLRAVYEHPDNPYRSQWMQRQDDLIRLLESVDDGALDQSLRARGESLRTLIRLLPPIFPKLWHEVLERGGMPHDV